MNLRFLKFVPIFTVTAALLCCSTKASPQPQVKILTGSNIGVKPANNLVVEGVPNIPSDLAERADLYTNYRLAELAGWHPTKVEMVINTRFCDTNQLHRLIAPGGARTQLTFFADRCNGGEYQPTNGDSCIFSKDRGGDEFFQKYSYRFSDQSSTLLTDGKSRNTGGVWNHKGDRFAYGSTRRNGKDVDVYAVDPNRPHSDRLVIELEGGGWEVLDWSPDDQKLLLLNEVSINEGYLWLVDCARGNKSRLTPAPPAEDDNEPVAYSGGRFSKDGHGIYTATDRDAEFKRLAFIDLAKLSHRYLTTEIKWDVSEFDLSEDGKRLAFLANEDGCNVLHLLDTESDKELAVAKLPAGNLSDLHWHKNSEDLGFVVTSARAPEDVYSLNVKTGKVDRWTESETGGIDTKDFAEPELVKWKSFDSKLISGYLYKPPSRFTGKRPVIVYIHGGPESQFRPRFLGRLNYILNELGCAIIFPNVRGSAGYGKTFLKLDNGKLRENSYKDIGALFDWIETRGDLDSDRVMVTGGSYGGHMTLAIASFYSDRIRCALDVVGMSNLVTFLEHTQEYRRDLRRVEYGDERIADMRQFLERIAPFNNTDKFKKPLFVVQGENDPRVPASESLQMVAKVRQSGTPVWFLMAHDEGHGFHKKKNIDFQFYATIMFIKKYLLSS